MGRLVQGMNNVSLGIIHPTNSLIKVMSNVRQFIPHEVRITDLHCNRPSKLQPLDFNLIHLNPPPHKKKQIYKNKTKQIN